MRFAILPSLMCVTSAVVAAPPDGFVPGGAGPMRVFAEAGKDGAIVVNYKVIVPVVETRVREVRGKDGKTRTETFNATRQVQETRAMMITMFEVTTVSGMKISREAFNKEVKKGETPILLLLNGAELSKRDKQFFRDDLSVVRVSKPDE